MTALHARATYHEALSRLSDRHLLRNLSYVAGHWVAGKTGRSFEVTDPASSATLAWVTSLDRKEAFEAIDAASDAFVAWRSLLPQRRSSILRRWYDLMLEAFADLGSVSVIPRVYKFKGV